MNAGFFFKGRGYTINFRIQKKVLENIQYVL